MLFYKIEAKIVGAKTCQAPNEDGGAKRKEFRESDAWINFKELAQQYSEEFFQRSGKKTYIFAVGIQNKTHVLFGLLSRGVLDPEALAKEYLELIDANFQNITVKEITLEAARSLLQTGDRLQLSDDCDGILERFGLDTLTRRYRGFAFDETILSECMNKQALINRSNSLLCGETLTPEIGRIYQVPSAAKGRGHPVHYMIQTNDSRVREQMVGVLLTALRNNNRIRSRRYCGVRVKGGGGLSWDFYDTLYQSCFDGAMVVEYGERDEAEGEYASPSGEMIEGLCRAMKKHANNVLTVICLPRSCEKIKAAFTERFEDVTVIPLTEETVFGEKAKKYLRQLAKNQMVTPDKSLYKPVKDLNKGYLAADLNRSFDEWYGVKLKTRVYPQYAAFESANRHTARQKPKGSAYAELEEMIGLADAKAVIRQAIDYHKAQRLFKEKGMTSEHTAMHMVFTGNPGTAKTTAARLFAQIMKDNGLLSAGGLYEVGRSDLIGKYVGWTARIVKEKFKEAKGSVLFIDEAYSLVDDRDGLYGDEAINTIVQEMENHREDMVVIFAGYPDKMEGFLQKNPGLRSRVAFHVPFADYNPEDLVQITELLADRKNITLAPDVKDKLLPIFAGAMKRDDFGNGRFARNMLEKAQLKHASRLIAMDIDAVSKQDVCTLTAGDFEAPATKDAPKIRIGF
jgi:AAA+ superfamily predicted ATPase